MIRLNVVFVAATVAAGLVSTAPMALARGHFGGGLPAGTMPTNYGTVWAAKQRAHEQSKSDPASNRAKSVQPGDAKTDRG